MENAKARIAGAIMGGLIGSMIGGFRDVDGKIFIKTITKGGIAGGIVGALFLGITITAILAGCAWAIGGYAGTFFTGNTTVGKITAGAFTAATLLSCML